MANHGFVTSRKHFKGDKIEKDIQEILARRFNNKVGYTRQGDYFEVGLGSKPEFPWSFTMWLATKRKLEFRHPNGDWNHWIFFVVQDELACKYGGMVSDEGVDGRWHGEPNKYPTFKDFINASYSHVPKLIRFGLQKINRPPGWKP